MLRERGLRRGDHLAVLLENQPEFFDAVWAANRIGLYVTPINWHLTAGEAGYIVADCGAAAVVASAGLADVVAGMEADLGAVTTRLSVGGDLPGFERYEDVVAGVDASPLEDESEGAWMLYSSGTTGKPKGILPPLPEGDLGAPSMITWMLTGMFGMSADSVYLSPAPLYHASPAGWTHGVQRLGATPVVMERFDALDLLAAIEHHRITHVQLVPTMMIRLLRLPEEDRRRFDLSSLVMVIHAAAPCPVAVKRACIEWLGPIVHEFYSGSEGAGLCYIGPEDWLAHPGSVGKSMTGTIRIVDDDGHDLPVGEEGQVWFETTRHFEYHGDPEKTKAAWDRERGRAWLGDVGHVDADGYLYLTDRASNMIISGGVNIYPREIEDVLVMHPDVDDVAVLGTPDPDMGEQVTAFVLLDPGASVTEEALIAWTRERLCALQVPAGDPLRRLAPPPPDGQAPQAPAPLACSSAFHGELTEAAAEVLLELLHGRARMLLEQGLEADEVGVALRVPLVGEAAALDPVDDLPHRTGHVEVLELRLAGELAVLAHRRVVLHLRGVALEAHQPVGPLDLARQHQLGDDRLQRDAVLEHHADEARGHPVERRGQRLLDAQVQHRLLHRASSRCRPAGARRSPWPRRARAPAPSRSRRGGHRRR